jgi:adenine-specific DNA-methyltransferase
MENEDFLKNQIITYLGNKRNLLDFINSAIEIIKNELGKEKLISADLFSGSGIVSRFLKQHSQKLIVNDWEDYCYIINKCYLTNKSSVDFNLLKKHYDDLENIIKDNLNDQGFIYKLYAPKNDEDIKLNERVFFTTRNAKYIDTARSYIEQIPEPYKTFMLASLLYEVSVKNNTSGVFKGFYKDKDTNIGKFGGSGENALSRIKADMKIDLPVFSNYECEVDIHKGDTNILIKNIEHVDVAYIDPPYNQHPYGSNYFMLNLVTNYKEPLEISEVSGIPNDWNRSDYNKKKKAKDAFLELCLNTNATYLLISFSSDGFIPKEEMIELLESVGNVRVLEQKYNTFRGSRNLKDRDIYIYEYLYLVRKEK